MAVSPARIEAVSCTDSGLQLQLRSLEPFGEKATREDMIEEEVVLALASLGGDGAVHHVAVRLGPRPLQVACSASLCTSASRSCCDINPV